MNRALILLSSLLFSSAVAMAADTSTTETKPGDAPTKAMDSATPEMKSPNDPNAEHPPAAAMDKAVPAMKSDDKANDSGDSTAPASK